jgi:hypothetical protein
VLAERIRRTSYWFTAEAVAEEDTAREDSVVAVGGMEEEDSVAAAAVASAVVSRSHLAGPARFRR